MNQTKRWITCLLVICLLAALISITANAAENGTCGENLTWTLNKGVLTISGTGAMDDYEFDSAPWSHRSSSIEKVVIKSGVASIGNCAFSYCSGIDQVTIPDTVTSIGEFAFIGCDWLGDMKVSCNVSFIGYNAFSRCAAMTKILVDQNNPYYSNDEYGILFDKAKTTVLQVPGGFSGHYSIPESVRVIGSGSFTGCSGMTGVTMPDSLTRIEYWAFGDCLGLTSVTIGKNVETIASLAFGYCENLTEIIFCGEAPSISEDAFSFVTANAYYPATESSWTTGVMQNYCGDITWNAAGSAMNAPQVSASNIASTGKIKLTWDNVDGAKEYKVYRATSKTGTYSLMKTTSSTSYTNTSAVTEKTYYYYVVAIDKNGTVSDKSKIVSRTCDLPQPEVTLSNIASSGKIKVSWEAVDGAVSYEVYRATSKTGEYKLMKTTSNLSYTNTSAAAGTAYYYKVKAIAEKSAANSAFSAIKSRTCDLPRPDAAINLNSSGKPKVSWEGMDGAVSYEVYRATSKTGEYKLMKTTSNLSYTNTSAEAGKTYYYKVVAVCSNTNGNSANSSIVSIKAK